MTGHLNQPLDGGAGAHAIKIAAAAQEAVKHLPQFSLGSGDINRIISMTSHGSLSIAERINLAQNIARDTAKAYLDQPRNNADAMERQVAQNPLGPRGLGAYEFSRLGPLAWQEGERGSGGGSTRGGVQYGPLNSASGWADVRTTPGSGYSMLSAANQHVAGFTREQVAGAANFLKGSGLNRQDINHDTRHMVHLQPHQSDIRDLIQRKKEIERRRKAGHDVTEPEREYEQHRQRVRNKMTPNQQRHFDQMRSINNSNKDMRSELGDEPARDSTEQQRADIKQGTPQAAAATTVQNGAVAKDVPRTDEGNVADLLASSGLPSPVQAQTPAAPAAPSAAAARAPATEPAREARNAPASEPKPPQAPTTRAPAGPTIA